MPVQFWKGSSYTGVYQASQAYRVNGRGAVLPITSKWIVKMIFQLSCYGRKAPCSCIMLKGVIFKFLPRTLKSENISALFVCVAVLSAQSRGVNLCRTEDILGHRKDSGKCWRLSLWKPITKLKGLTMALLQKLFLSYHVYLYGIFFPAKIINVKKNKLHFSVFLFKWKYILIFWVCRRDNQIKYLATLIS